ncbi:MAG TPA: class I SAM-dependent methyltransferase [Noviherbaspirillum sp.]|nr:class I SAM-dependent methyltransferase [Noviherbaspirillum sp.]
MQPDPFHDVSRYSRRKLLQWCGATALYGLAGGALSAKSGPVRPIDVPYVPTPQNVVDKMLQMASVKKNDLLYDLGCGDGRLVVTAAQRYGARGVGIDLDPERVEEARQNARRAKVSDRTTFKVADLFETDFSDATVVTLYLLNSVNRKLRPQLWRQLKVGTRIVSHAFDMGDEWPPEKTEVVDGSTIYFWTLKEEHKRAVS